MEKWYPVHMGSSAVGKVRVIQQGLYYVFRCRCRVGETVMCRLSVCCGEKREDLGIVVPVDGGFGLETRLPVKRLGQGELAFFLTPKGTLEAETIIPVYPEEPFAYLSQLKRAYLIKRDGQCCIGLK